MGICGIIVAIEREKKGKERESGKERERENRQSSEEGGWWVGGRRGPDPNLVWWADHRSQSCVRLPLTYLLPFLEAHNLQTSMPDPLQTPR